MASRHVGYETLRNDLLFSSIVEMSYDDGRIQPLPSDVVAKIKSSTSITHLNGVIVELVKNSLDAYAHSISVTVDFQRGSCIVEDDGDGIPAAEFEPNGGLGKAHRMSMTHALFLSSSYMAYRYVKISTKYRSIWSKGTIPRLIGVSIAADHNIPPHPSTKYKHYCITSLQGCVSVDSSACTSET